MSQMGAFDALVASLGEHVVDYIGKDNLDSVSVVADRSTGEASVVIVPRVISAETSDHIIRKMLEVRSMFHGELAIEYVIADSDDHATASTDRQAVFVTS